MSGLYSDEEIALQARIIGASQAADVIERLTRENNGLRDTIKRIKTNAAAVPKWCPITGLKFFMTIHHPDLGWVSTYGGPYDSYTIPYVEDADTKPLHEREFIRAVYDHDKGGWSDWEHVELRLIEEEDLAHLLNDRDRLEEIACVVKGMEPRREKGRQPE